jgi:steroid delta-isomerase
VTEPAELHATFAAYTKAIESRDRTALLALFADDIVQIDPYPSDPNVGKDAVGAFFDQTWAMTEAMQFTIGGAIVSGDRGVFPFTVRSTVGGGQVEVDAIDVVRFTDDGRIAEITAFVDYAGMRTL